MTNNQSTAEAESKAFFALDRKVLYWGAFIVIANVAVLLVAIGFLMNKGMSNWIVPLLPFNLFLYLSILVKSPEGRGCLRNIGLGHDTWKLEPKNQVTASIILTVLGVLFALIKYL